MKISKRTRLSLCQFLPLLGRDRIGILFEKYEIPADEVLYGYHGSLDKEVKETVLAASDAQVGEVLQELARTGNAIRKGISPKVLYDEPWEDLELCLQLDNIVRAKDEIGRVQGVFVPVEPAIDGVQPIDDDLTGELNRSGLPGVNEILAMIEESANAFRAGSKNSCLNAARVALQDLAKSIAIERRAAHPGIFAEDKWGQVVSYLRSSGFITEKQEEGLTGVYSFISPGSHVPLGFSELEFARLGRTLAFSCCYFLVKATNAGKL